MKKRTKAILGVAAVVALALAVAIPVYAATSTDTTGTDTWGPGSEYCGQGRGLMMGDGVRGIDAAAEALGMDVDDLMAERHDGKSLADIAASKGISTDELISAMLDAREAALDEAVDSGRITQEQADYMLEHMSDEMAEHVDDTETGPHNDARGFGGRGMHGAGEGICVYQ